MADQYYKTALTECALISNQSVNSTGGSEPNYRPPQSINMSIRQKTKELVNNEMQNEIVKHVESLQIQGNFLKMAAEEKVISSGKAINITLSKGHLNS